MRRSKDEPEEFSLVHKGVEDLAKAAVQLRVGGSGVTSLRSLRPKLALVRDG